MGPDHRDDDRRITYFAATHTRGKSEMFGIRAADRGKHVYIIGKTGMGKSTMLENMAIQDIQNGEGRIFIDPHGSTAEKLLDFVPRLARHMLPDAVLKDFHPAARCDPKVAHFEWAFTAPSDALRFSDEVSRPAYEPRREPV